MADSANKTTKCECPPGYEQECVFLSTCPRVPRVRPHTATVAERIADELLVNGSGERGERLVIELPGKRDGGGWCRAAIIARVGAVLQEGANA